MMKPKKRIIKKKLIKKSIVMKLFSIKASIHTTLHTITNTKT